MQQAFQENHGLQCGYCTPGMVMAAVSLLEENPNPTEARGAHRPGGQPLPLHRLPQHRASRCWPPREDAGATRDMTVRRRHRAAAVIGTPMLRKEDPALLTGEARYTNDLAIPGALHLALLRSPYAHARITSVDVSGAAGACPVSSPPTPAPTSRTLWAAPMPCAWPVTRRHEEPCPLPAGGVEGLLRRRRGGRASSPPARQRRRTRVDAIDVAVRAARRGDRPRGRAVGPGRHPRRPRHQQELHVGAQGRARRAVDAAFAAAAHTVKERYVQQRLIPMAMEPRAVAAVPAAVRRRHDALLGHPDPAHPEDHDRADARHPRAPDARRRAERRRRLRLEAQRVRRGAAVRRPRPASTACPCAGTRSGRRTRWPPSRAAARSRTSSWRPTPTAS